VRAFLIRIAIEPKSRRDVEAFKVALNLLAAEDEHGFDIESDPETGQTVVGGLSEQHLEWLVDRMSSKHGIAVNVGAPQVAYRETLGRRCEIDYTYKKLSGGAGQFARVKLVFEPGQPGSGYSFDSRIVGGSVPEEYIPGVEKGLEASRETGVLAGFPVIDFRVTLIDGAYHDVDSSVLAFEIAARAAFKEGLNKAQCKLLEPIMKVEVVTPEDYMGDCIGDLNSRRGQIQGMEARGNAQVINAMVPLANMFGYAASLRLLAKRQGTFTLAFDHYAPIPMPPNDDDPSAPAVALRP
jgi:elongation factor G